MYSHVILVSFYCWAPPSITCRRCSRNSSWLTNQLMKRWLTVSLWLVKCFTDMLTEDVDTSDVVHKATRKQDVCYVSSFYKVDIRTWHRILQDELLAEANDAKVRSVFISAAVDWSWWLHFVADWHVFDIKDTKLQSQFKLDTQLFCGWNVCM